MEEQIKALESKYNVKINLRNVFKKTMYSVHYNESNLSGVFKSIEQIENTCIEVLKIEKVELTSKISKIENKYIKSLDINDKYIISLNGQDFKESDHLVNVKSNIINILDNHINNIEKFNSICVNTLPTEPTNQSRNYIIKLNGQYYFDKLGVYKKTSQDYFSGWYNYSCNSEGEKFNFSNYKKDAKIIRSIRTLKGIIRDLFTYCKEFSIDVNTLEILSI